MMLRSLFLASSLGVVGAQLAELGYAGIRGWWNDCTIDNELCGNGELKLLAEPLFFDFDTCYSNPNLGLQSVTFFGKDLSGVSMMYNIIITGGSDALTEYSPTDCDAATGACACTANLRLADLRNKTLSEGVCSDLDNYFKCDAMIFDPLRVECWVPTTITSGLLSDPQGEQFYCSMAASLQTYEDQTPGGLGVSTPPPPSDAGTSSPPDDTPAPSPATDPIANDLGETSVGDNFPISPFAIPAYAEDAYCTAIMGWYDGCSLPRDGTTDNFCTEAVFTELAEPLFVDMAVCYSNPHLEEGRAVSFFGETPDETRFIEFHMIFHNDTSTEAAKYKPLNCDAVTGRCDCSADMVALKKTFLEQGGCEDTYDYECMAEDFWGDTDTCFVPATYEWGSENRSQIYCNMVAEVQQFSPCNTVLAIPEEAKETFCSGITGWYDTCAEVGLGEDICDIGNLVPLADPLFLDLETCYVNPNFPDGRAVSFYGKIANSTIRQFHVIAKPEAGDKYKPTDCQPNGACTCTQTLLDLKATFVSSATCSEGLDYTCQYDFFSGFEFDGPERCYVPGTQLEEILNSPVGDLTCSMLASVEHFGPCNKQATLNGTDPADPNGFNPDNVVVPEGSQEAYCTAITGWYDGCTGSDPAGFACAGFGLTPINPLFVNFTACYANPAFNQRTVSFFGKGADGDVKEFHVILQKENLAFEPTSCDANGVCVCPQAIVDLREAALADPTACTLTDDIACQIGSFTGDTEECWVPTQMLIGTEFLCTMAARVEQFYPCDFSPPSESPTMTPVPSAAGQVNEAPFDEIGQAIDEAKAKELDYTAITGWWNGCLARDESNANDPCEKATNIRYEKPLYLNLDTCYKNPKLGSPHNSVSFFLKDASGQAFAYHLLFESTSAFGDWAPANCNTRGECSCGSAQELSDMRDSLAGAKECTDGVGYKCKRELFIGLSMDCYVPVQEIFDNGLTVCSMAASIEQIPITNINATGLGEGSQGEASMPNVPNDGDTSAAASATNGNKNGGFPIWATVVICIAGVIIVSFLVLGAIRYRRQGHFGSRHGDDEEVWVRNGSHDSKFTRRALNTDDQGDGVWKRENINDLKFQNSSVT